MEEKTMIEKPRIEEWKDLRFGMFIHWGLYALLGKGEWAMYQQPIDRDEYRKLKDQFTAEKFDARAWAKAAKDAGMKYMVLTTRHHDGFSLWDSPGSVGNFTSMNSAARKDFVREYVEACREAGLKVGLYYSPLDWRFEGYFFPNMYKESAMQMRQQTHDQIRELLTDYGKIDILWYDGGEDNWLGLGYNHHNLSAPRGELQCPNFWGAAELDEMARTLQPGIVINNRTGLKDFGDFRTPEETIGNFDVEHPWESCMTINGIWGWVPDRKPHSLRELILMVTQAATGDGNVLLNVGPRADGSMEPVQVERLAEVGAWLNEYGEAIYGTRGGPFKNTKHGGTTYKGNTIYVHIWNWEENVVTLPKIDANILSVSSLTAKELGYQIEDGVLTFNVGAQDRKDYNTIIKIELDRPVSELPIGEEFWTR